MENPERYLYLMRHASAESDNRIIDFKRPLSEKGYLEIEAQIKAFKKTNGIRPDCILCSTSYRTKQTAEKLKELFIGIPVFYRETLYLASAFRLMEIIQDLDEMFRRVLIIAHNPGLEQMMFLLDNSYKMKHLKRADCVSIKMNVPNWQMIKAGSGIFEKYFPVRI